LYGAQIIIIIDIIYLLLPSIFMIPTRPLVTEVVKNEPDWFNSMATDTYFESSVTLIAWVWMSQMMVKIL
jgi:hypothetical protein